MLLRKEWHRTIYLGSLLLLALSLPLSIFATSLAQIILVGNWIASGSFREKRDRIRANRPLLLFMGLFLLHLAGMLWTSDLAYGLKDLQIKLPLFVLPLVIGSSEPLRKRDRSNLLLVFSAGVFIASMATMLAMAGVIHTDPLDFRNYSLFISHIRFSLMVVLAWGISVNALFIEKEGLRKSERIFQLIQLIWLPVFLIFLRALSGLVIFAALIFLLALVRIVRMKEPVTRFMLVVFLLMLPLFSILYVGSVIKDFYTTDLVEVSALDSLTIEGNPYIHNTTSTETENGHYIWIYLCPSELAREWNKVSEMDFNGRDRLGQKLSNTLIRYMTSRNLRKDAAGFRQLSEEDVRAVENGMTSIVYLRKYSLYPRIYELVWEFDNYSRSGNPNGHSVIQRKLYLEAGWYIARTHLWLGVGTGDVPQSFEKYYQETASQLSEKWRRRAHNQYLTLVITFGFPLGLLALFMMVWPALKTKRWRLFLPFVFLFVMAMSMLNEDTLETSAGVTPFALFYVLLILLEPEGTNKDGELSA